VRLPFWRFFVADLSGKVVLSVIVAYLGRVYFSAAGALLNEDSLPILIIAAAATAVLSVVIARSDWILAIEIAREKGLRSVVANLGRILRPRKAGRDDRSQDKETR
jgi:membrane protein DedA with SNARE-associated domain